MIMDPNFIVKVLLSLIVAAALAFAVTPLVKRLAQRVGAMDVPKDERRMHKIPIPRMGGLAIFFAFLIAVLCFAGIDRELRGILLGATIIVVLGILDDILTLKALPKFAVQIVAAVIAVLHGCRIEHFMGFRLATWLSYPVSVIWIVAITNAVNFIDGLDGLAAGVSAISAGSMLVVALLVWAAWAPIDEVTHAEGSVVGSRRTQSVSNLEGGILQAVLVREGEVVEKGQVVAQLENVMAESSYRDALYKLVEHRLAVMRLEAMLRDEEPVFPSDLPVFLKEILGEEPDGVLVERARQIVDDQRNTWKAQSSKLRAELSMLEAQYAQRQSEVAEQLARKKQLDGSLVLETEQRDTAKRLLQRNNYSRMDYLGLEQKIIQTQGEIDMLAAAIPKTQAMMDEARQRIGSRVAEEQLAISQEINKRRTELGSVRESLTAGGDRVTRTEVRSPVRGSVKQILVNTVGGVVKPGEAIMDIVPMDESLLVEVRVRPQDVAFLRPGQDVMIKVSAYDFSIYGGLPGKLESISADTIEDKKGDFYYLVKVRTGETAIRRNDEILPIIPGMIVVADIIIGKKTVLDYILKPVMKARQNALTER